VAGSEPYVVPIRYPHSLSLGNDPMSSGNAADGFDTGLSPAIEEPGSLRSDNSSHKAVSGPTLAGNAPTGGSFAVDFPDSAIVVAASLPG